MELDIEDDFATIVDGVEPATLRRRGSTSTIAVSWAHRQHVSSREAEPSSGAAVESNAEWHLVFAGDVAPQVGDVVIDAEDNHWTILVAEKLALLNRWKCATRELRIAYGCGERVDIERPVWSEGEPPEIVGWNYMVTALPARIQPVEVGVDENGAEEAVFRIVLGESIALEPKDRFVAGDGTVYYLRSYQQAERIDALSVAVAVRGSE